MKAKSDLWDASMWKRACLLRRGWWLGCGMLILRGQFVLGRIGPDLAVLMIEVKVEESFGPLLGEWLPDASPGKLKRLEHLRPGVEQ
jgi:hypothetical protein